ncbi:hypothetical protein SAMN05216327_101512 [Dyadobacter sp. SG02]|nr:hypothetical protein SAMN05216327_101512 [Dyadobacter sp. SG02]
MHLVYIFNIPLINWIIILQKSTLHSIMIFGYVNTPLRPVFITVSTKNAGTHQNGRSGHPVNFNEKLILFGLETVAYQWRIIDSP